MALAPEPSTCVSHLAIAAGASTTEPCQEEKRSSLAEPVGSVEGSESSTLNGARRAFLTNPVKTRAMLYQPNDFLRGLALHTQLLACLQWLCEFQVLACVPLDDSVPFKDVADICGVPEAQLCRVTRLMATAGFLREPRLGRIAHSPLSARFVTEPALLDAAMFLSGTAAPAALKMPLASRQFAGSDRADQSAYAAAFDTGIPLASVFELQPRIQRQFATYLSCVASDEETAVRDVLMQVDWGSLGNATVVDVGASSPATAIGLVSLFPSLQFVVQTYEVGQIKSPCFFLGGKGLTSAATDASGASSPGLSIAEIPAHLSGKITTQKRTPGTTQFVRPAAVYILRLPSPCPSMPWSMASAQVVSELTAHIGVLRTNPGSRLVLTALVLPAQGTVDAEIEAAARVQDLSLLQLANGRYAEEAEVVELLNGIRDSAGGFVLTEEIRSASSACVAWEMRYAAHEDMKH